MTSRDPASRDLPTEAGPAQDTSRDLDRAFDRDEVSAILRRAIALAADEHHPVGDKLSARDLAAVADEVGVPPAALATALAESRARARRDGRRIQRLLDRVVGPSEVWAAGQVRGDDEAATASIQRWLEVDHGLTTYVRDDGVVVASRKGGVAGAIGSGVRRIQGIGGLDRARSVRAATAAVDDDGAVCVVADVANKRAEAIVGGTAVAGSSMAAVGVVAIVAGPVALVGLPIAAVVGAGTARLVHRRTLYQVGRQVEQTAHAMTRDQAPVHPVAKMLRSGLPRRSAG